MEDPLSKFPIRLSRSVLHARVWQGVLGINFWYYQELYWWCVYIWRAAKYQMEKKSFVLATNIEGRVIFPACMLLLKVISVSFLKYWWTFTIFHWKSKRSGLWESCYKNLPLSKWHIMKDICNFKVLPMSCFAKCLVPLLYVATKCYQIKRP